MTNRQNELRAHDLVQVCGAVKKASFLAQHATQHSRDAGEADSTAQGFFTSLATLETNLRTEIATVAASFPAAGPGEKSKERLEVEHFLSATG